MNEKNRRLEPQVGIFWLLKNCRLVFDLTPLSEAEPYGDSLTHPRGHAQKWETLQASGYVPAETEYEELPRGRVVYQQKAARFTVFADPCILTKSASIKEILAMMHLPETQTEFRSDSHYRCFVCLSRPRLV